MADDPKHNISSCFNNSERDKRKILQAKRPSSKQYNLKKDPIILGKNERTSGHGQKRKISSDMSDLSYKKHKTENFTPPKYLAKNIAQQRLQKLRRSLQNNLKESEHINKINNSANNSYTEKKYSSQVHRTISETSTLKSLNSYKKPENSYNRESYSKHKLNKSESDMTLRNEHLGNTSTPNKKTKSIQHRLSFKIPQKKCGNEMKNSASDLSTRNDSKVNTTLHQKKKDINLITKNSKRNTAFHTKTLDANSPLLQNVTHKSIWDRLPSDFSPNETKRSTRNDSEVNTTIYPKKNHIDTFTQNSKTNITIETNSPLQNVSHNAIWDRLPSNLMSNEMKSSTRKDSKASTIYLKKNDFDSFNPNTKINTAFYTKTFDNNSTSQNETHKSIWDRLPSNFTPNEYEKQTKSFATVSPSSNVGSINTIFHSKHPDHTMSRQNTIEDSIWERSSSNFTSRKFEHESKSPTNFSPISNVNISRETNCNNLNYNCSSESFSPSILFDNFSDGNMSMEWSPVTEEKIIENISEIRKEIHYNDHIAEISFNNDLDRNIKSINGVFIVVDTNIFLSNLAFITDLKKMNFKDLGPTIIVVPWMVIQELDYMKDGRSCSRSLKTGATKAVNFINDCLTNKDPNFKGQNVIEASQHDLSSNNPDDGILFCCLQLAKQGKSVVLLSNDKNLRNKVLVNNILAFSKDEIVNSLKNLSNKTRNNSQQQTGLCSVAKIKIILSNILTIIIENEMKKAYGDIWTKMAAVVPPLTIEEAIQCIIKYWVAVFSFNMLKQCKQCVDEFKIFLCKIGNRDLLDKDDRDKYIEFSLKLCIYLKNGYSIYNPDICQAIQNIQQCVS